MGHNLLFIRFNWKKYTVGYCELMDYDLQSLPPFNRNYL